MSQSTQNALTAINLVKPWETHEKAQTGKTPRCCAPGCGDKIKDDTCIELVFVDGTKRYLEQDCLDWYVNGHPDVGGGVGLLTIAHESFFKKHGPDNAAVVSPKAKRTWLRAEMANCPACAPEDVDVLHDNELDNWIRNHIQ